MSRVRRHRADVGLILIVGSLLTLGLIVIYSVSPVLSHELLDDASRNHFFYSQLLNIGVGIAAFVFAMQLPVAQWRKILPFLLIGVALSLVLMFMPQLGVSEGGATRWLALGPFSFQPSEPLKFLLVIGAATWFARLSKEEIRNYKYTLLPVVAVLGVVSFFVLVHQRDLGTMLVMAAIVTVIFFVSGTKLRHLGVLLGLGSTAGLASIVMMPHRMERVRTFFHPEEGLAESSYHLHQALIAVGSGGLFGLGLGGSVQVYGYLPEAANDSIFAIISETFGLLGALAVLGLFALLIYRCFIIAGRSQDDFSRYIVLGVTTWIGVQAMINVMAMIGIIPLTGITLPFISYGGSSILFAMLALGVVTQVSKYTVRNSHENRSQRRRQRRTHNAYSSRRPSPQGVR